MPRMTITEALAETKTLAKRIISKREFVGQHLARQEAFKDPLLADGGERAAVSSAMQAVVDLEENIVRIRGAIAASNLATLITVCGRERTVAAWLAWRRDVAPSRGDALKRMAMAVQKTRQDAQAKGCKVLPEGVSGNDRTDVVINLSETDLAKQIEEHENVLGTLDGQLSLKNATTFVEF